MRKNGMNFDDADVVNYFYGLYRQENPFSPLAMVESRQRGQVFLDEDRYDYAMDACLEHLFGYDGDTEHLKTCMEMYSVFALSGSIRHMRSDVGQSSGELQRYPGFFMKTLEDKKSLPTIERMLWSLSLTVLVAAAIILICCLPMRAGTWESRGWIIAAGVADALLGVWAWTYFNRIWIGAVFAVGAFSVESLIARHYAPGVLLKFACLGVLVFCLVLVIKQLIPTLQALKKGVNYRNRQALIRYKELSMEMTRTGAELRELLKEPERLEQTGILERYSREKIELALKMFQQYGSHVSSLVRKKR